MSASARFTTMVQGVAKDYAKAREWFEKAVDKGNTGASSSAAFGSWANPLMACSISLLEQALGRFGKSQMRQAGWPATTAKISTTAPLPLNGTSPRACVGTLPFNAHCVASSISNPHPATLVWVSSRAARFTGSPMQV